MLRVWWNKLSHWRGREAFDESLQEELRLHIEERSAELVQQGMTENDARAQAARELGSTARLAEESRDAWRWMWLEDLARDLRHATRGLLKDRGFAAAAVLSLGLGIGVNTAMFSITAEFLFSQPTVRDPGTLMLAQIGRSNAVSMREWRFLRDARVFDELAGANPMQEVNWRTGDTSLRLFVTRVTENYFDVTDVPVALGRPIGEGERGAVLISHRFWHSRLSGDPQVLGRTLTLDGRAYSIVGVLPRVHRTLTGFGYVPDLYMTIPGDAGMVALYGRSARDGRAAMIEKLKVAAAELDRMYPDGENARAASVRVTSLTGVERLSERVVLWTSAFFALLLVVSGLLLLIACANVASLLLARSAARTQEFAIRMSIGAGRGRLVRQLLAESLFLSLLGTAAGLLLNYTVTRAVNWIPLTLPFPVQLSIEPDLRLLAYAVCIAVATALLVGILPALKSTNPGALLKRDEHQVSGPRANLRALLVSGQIAVSVVTMILAALSVRNLLEATRLSPGFDLNRTVWAQVRLVPENYGSVAKVRALAAAAVERLSGLPGVESATVASFVPLNDHFLSRRLEAFADSLPEGKRIEHWWNAIGPDYLRTMGIGLVAGREFTIADREEGARVAIVNEAFAREAFGSASPVGQRLRFGRDDKSDRLVVGVSRNSKYSSIGERDRPAVYEPFHQVAGGRTSLNFLVRTAGSPDMVVRAVNAAILDLDPTAAAEIRPMSRATAFALLPSRLGAGMLGTIGLLGLALASVGLYGVMAYSVSRRTREIGLRVALGASPGGVVRLVMLEVAWVLGGGLVIGVGLAVAIAKPLVRFLVPGLQPTDSVAYGTVVFVLIGVGLVAGFVPALRALRIDAMSALRYE